METLSHYTPEIAALLYVAGIGLLLFSLWRERSEYADKRRETESGRGELADALRSFAALQNDMAQLQDQYCALRQRQDQLEQRAPDAQRFEHALRIIRKGVADTEALCDMGISQGEARLLMRLHGAGEESEGGESEPPAASLQGEALARAMQG